MTKKEAFAKAEEEYRQARSNTVMLRKELSAIKAAVKDAETAEWDASVKYYSYVKPTTEAMKYMDYLVECGLK